MRKSIKGGIVATSLALGFVPAIASAQVHSHPSRQTLTNTPPLSQGDRAPPIASESYQAVPGQTWAPSCPASGCGEYVLYGVGY